MYNTHFPSMMDSRLGLAPVVVTAGGAADNVAQNGDAIDRLDFYSGVVAVPVAVSLTTDETATVSVKVQDSADGSTGWADFATGTDLELTDADTEGIAELDLNLQAAKRYIRVVVTSNLSAGATDTATIGAVLTLTGSIENPV